MRPHITAHLLLVDGDEDALEDGGDVRVQMLRLGARQVLQNQRGRVPFDLAAHRRFVSAT